MSKNTDVIEIVAQAFREIKQPCADGLCFMCEANSVFSAYDSILGIPVYVVPILNARGGLLLGTKSCQYNEMDSKCLKFQEIMEDLMSDIEED